MGEKRDPAFGVRQNHVHPVNDRPEPADTSPDDHATTPRGSVSEPTTSAPVATEAPAPTHAPAGPGPRTRRTAVAAAVLAAAEVAGKVATLAFMIAAARTLGTDGFGLFAFALSFSLLVATLPSWGFDPLLVQRGSADRERLPVLLSETLVWRTAVAVPVFLAAGVAGLVLRPGREAALALVLVLAATLADLYVDAGRAVCGALQRQPLAARVIVIERFGQAGLAIAALALGWGLLGLCGAYLAGTAIGGVTMLLTVRRLGVRASLTGVTREGLARTGKLSVALGIDTLVSLALAKVDQVLLATMKGDAAVGVYAACYRLFETVLFVSWAVSRSVFPVMSAAPDRWRVRRGVEQGLAVVSLLYIPFAVGLWIDAEQVLRLLFGQPFAAAGAPIARWLAPAPLLFAIGFLGSYGLVAVERRAKVVVASVIAAVVNVGLNLLLIPRFSGVGAAIATIAAYGAEAAVVMVFVAQHIGWIRLQRAVVVPALAAAAMAVFLVLFDGAILGEVALGAVVYGVSWYAVARAVAPEQVAVLASVVPWRR